MGCVRVFKRARWCDVDTGSAKPVAEVGAFPMTTLGCTEHRDYNATVGEAKTTGATRNKKTMQPRRHGIQTFWK
jgi:hypothetical protein